MSLLRPVLPDDLPVFFEHQRDPEAVALVATKSKDRPTFDAHWAKIMGDRSTRLRTIVVDGDAAGYLTVFTRTGDGPEAGLREIGYWLGREHWGKGIGTAALKEFLTLVEERPLWARVSKANTASWKLALKCGFVVHNEGPFTVDGVTVVEYLLKLG